MIAVSRHFILNEQDTKITQVDELIDEGLYEIYVWPFTDMVCKGICSIIPAYNLLNETFSTESGFLLNRILKSDLGLLGFTVSDWWATHSSQSPSEEWI